MCKWIRALDSFIHVVFYVNEPCDLYVNESYSFPWHIHFPDTFTSLHIHFLYLFISFSHSFIWDHLCDVPWMPWIWGMGWLRLVASFNLYVSFAEYRLFYRALLQKRLIILRSLLIVATPYALRLYAWRDPIIWVTWLIGLREISFVCDMTHASAWYDLFICVTWLIPKCDMTHFLRDMTESSE